MTRLLLPQETVFSAVRQEILSFIEQGQPRNLDACPSQRATVEFYMRVIACIATLHNLWLVALSALVCIGGGVVAFALFRRAVQRRGVQRSGWIFLGAIAAGCSVWCTHFIAMLAYEVNAPVHYDPILTMISLLIVIAGSAATFHLAATPGRLKAIAAGALLGLFIAAMHYTGMMAYHVEGLIRWEMGYVAASVALSMVFGALAMLLATDGRLPLAVGLFVAAVVSLHFTGMTAVSVLPMAAGGSLGDPAEVASMAVAVAGVAMLIVGTGVVSQMIDADVSEKNLDVLRQMALNDALTGLPNRTSFLNHLNQQLARPRQAGAKVAVIGVDLDKFKEINDIRGHEAGDQALRAIADGLCATLKDGEFVARIGGDEFAAVKCFTQQKDLTDFLARLETVFFTPIVSDGFEAVPGASIGVSIHPQDGDTAARLISNADLAMYRVKSDLSRAVCFYEPEMDETARARRDLAMDLKRAIERNQLSLHFQVQTDVAKREVLGYEALLRWNHPERGYIPPVEFIALAEETGTIIPIGEWVLREACREAASWGNADKIAVNLSAVQIAHSDLPEIVERVLSETGLKADRLELEITETAIIQDKVRTLSALRQIKALGATIAIDDFGTGYSSLETLRSFPFDRIKLDRSFISDVEHSAPDRAIIRAVLALGKSLHISVLAEGVETREQLQLLQSEGCNEIQGYLLGRPNPPPPLGFKMGVIEPLPT